MANDLGSRALPAEAVADRLHSAAVRLLRGLRREDARSGIGPARLSALSVLVFGGPTSLARLAAAEQVRPSTMSRIVAALEADGLVARRRHPRDARQVVLAATPAGRRVMQAGRRRRVRALAGRLRALAPGELARLAAATELLERAAAAPSGRRRVGSLTRARRGAAAAAKARGRLPRDAHGGR